tara:strand:+ start:134 stop:325 length:192 start_codon:yes stop_codon:yes gene_type:complete
MKNLFLILSIIILSGCQTTYITDEGKRLLGNTAIGCVAGEILFGECEKGAAVGAGATIISDQK